MTTTSGGPKRSEANGVRQPMLSAASDDELFGDGWLTKHLDALMDELAARPQEFWPRLTGSRAEAQVAIDAELHRRAARIRHAIPGWVAE